MKTEKLNSPGRKHKSIQALPLILAALMACSGTIFGQSVAVQSIDSVVAAQPGAPDSIVRLTADAQGLTQVQPDALPKTGTFWLIMPGLNGVAAPLPCPPDDVSLPVYQIADGQFLVDATGGQFAASPQLADRMVTTSAVTAALEQQASAVVSLINQVQESQLEQDIAFEFGLDGDSGGASPNDLSSGIPDYGTNLWIAQVSVLTGNLNGIATNTQADISYDILSRTNLMQTDWQYERSILGSEATNWTPLSVSQNGRPILFLRLRSNADDGSGLPLWWQLKYFGITGVDLAGKLYSTDSK